jgi:hypothetical protein
MLDCESYGDEEGDIHNAGVKPPHVPGIDYES